MKTEKRISLFYKTVILLALLLIQACSASRVIEPLAKGEQQLIIAAGGPLFYYDKSLLPMPLSSIAFAKGVKDDLTLFVGLHTTALLYGVLQTDLGVVKELRKATEHGPGISIAPTLNLMIDSWEKHGKLYPSIDINAYWKLNSGRDRYYLGMSNWFELAGRRAHGETQPQNWIPALHTGYILQGESWKYNFELKHLAPIYDNSNSTVDYFRPTDRGAWGLYFSMARSW